MIRLCEPRFDAADRARIDEVLASGMLVQGRMVAALEDRLSQRLGRPVVACSNGTAALHLALAAAGVGPGDDVVIPALTWPSAASVAMLLGARCVFIDVDPERFHLQVDALESALTPATKAIVPIHQFGIPAPMAAVDAIARAHGVAVVEDAACAIGVTVDGREAGTWGDYGCFSFHPRKVVTTGEGGAIVARDEASAARLRILRNHGQDPAGDLLRFVEPGWNYRMPELGAAIGLGQLDRLDATVARRRELACRYAAGLEPQAHVHVPRGVLDAGGNVQSFVVRLAPTLDRARFLAALRAQDVECTIGTYAVAPQPAFGGHDPNEHPVARDAMHQLVTLPLHEAMSDEDVDTACAAVARAALEAEA